MFVKDRRGQFVPCPSCGSTDLRYSDRIRPLDLFWWLLGKQALRCRKCRTRFYERTDEAVTKMWVP